MSSGTCEEGKTEIWLCRSVRGAWSVFGSNKGSQRGFKIYNPAFSVSLSRTPPKLVFCPNVLDSLEAWYFSLWISWCSGKVGDENRGPSEQAGRSAFPHSTWSQDSWAKEYSLQHYPFPRGCTHVSTTTSPMVFPRPRGSRGWLGERGWLMGFPQRWWKGGKEATS